MIMCAHCGRFEVGDDRICRACFPKPKPPAPHRSRLLGSVAILAFLAGIPGANQDPEPKSE